MLDLKPFKTQIYYKNVNKQIDAMNDVLMLITMLFQLHPESVKLTLKYKTHWKIQSVVSFDVDDDKDVEHVL